MKKGDYRTALRSPDNVKIREAAFYGVGFVSGAHVLSQSIRHILRQQPDRVIGKFLKALVSGLYALRRIDCRNKPH